MATEWEDILAKHGIIEKREIPRAPTAQEYDAAAAYVRDELHAFGKAAVENASLDVLDELLDDDDFDSNELEKYRQARIAELKAQAAKSKFGELYHINETEYKRHVTEADPAIHVVVFLFKPSIPACQLMEKHLRVLAPKFPEVKFVKIRSEEAIPNYPDRNLPTLLVYHSSNVKVTWIGTERFGGDLMTPEDLEWQLGQIGALRSQLAEDPAVIRRNRRTQVNRGFSLRRGTNESDSDSDSD